MNCPMCDTTLLNKDQTNLFHFTPFLISVVKSFSPMIPVHKIDFYSKTDGRYSNGQRWWKITLYNLYAHEYGIIATHPKCAVCSKKRHGQQVWQKENGFRTVRLSMKCSCYKMLSLLDHLNNHNSYREIRKCVKRF